MVRTELIVCSKANDVQVDYSMILDTHLTHPLKWIPAPVQVPTQANGKSVERKRQRLKKETKLTCAHFPTEIREIATEINMKQ